jgi:hypothetical protein
MFNEKFKSLTGLTWEEAATQCNLLLLEANKLDEEAYRLLAADRLHADLWTRFNDTRKAAERRRAEARREWLRVTRILNSLDARAGRAAFHGRTVH